MGHISTDWLTFCEVREGRYLMRCTLQGAVIFLIFTFTVDARHGSGSLSRIACLGGEVPREAGSYVSHVSVPKRYGRYVVVLRVLSTQAH